MAQRNRKKSATSKRTVKESSNPMRGAAEAGPVPAAPTEAGRRGSSIGNWIIVIVLLVVAWEVGSSYFGNLEAKKYLVLKKVSQFTGTVSTGSPMSAFGLAVVGPHELAVADAKGCRVMLFNFDGKLLRSWGKRGQKGPDEFNEPVDLSIDPQGHLYVLDSWNGAIKYFDLKGKFYHAIDLRKMGVFFGPREILWAGDYFLMPSGDKLVRLSTTTEKVMDIIGTKGSGDGQFEGASGVALDSQGDFYVGDRGNKRVEEFDKSGKFIREIKTHSSPNFIALDSKGRLFVGSDTDPSKVFDASGKFLGILTEQSRPQVPIPVGSICVSPDGLLVVGSDDQVTVYQVPDEPEQQ